MTKHLIKAGVALAALTAICASVPASAQDDMGMHHRMMRHEMHREMRHEMMRHEMRREMRHRMMRHEMHREMRHRMMHDHM